MIQAVKPDLVIGFGGIGSAAAIISAKLLKIPSLIHEQNVVPGLANRLLGQLTSKVAVGFSKSNTHFKNTEVVFTGNPIRAELKKIDKVRSRESLDLDKNKFTILVMGGSQGAVFINDCFIRAIKGISVKQRGRLQVIHCCGKKDFTQTKRKYKEIDVEARIFAFCEDMNSAYSAADLIVGRAGAAALNEICFFGKASILIPYPYAQAHQSANAEFMREAQAAAVIKQDEMSVDRINSLIGVMIDEPQVLDSMGEKSGQLFYRDGAGKLADTAMSILENRR